MRQTKDTQDTQDIQRAIERGETIPFHKEDMGAKPPKRSRPTTRRITNPKRLSFTTWRMMKALLSEKTREEARALFTAYRKDPNGIYADFCDWMVAEHYGYGPKN